MAACTLLILTYKGKHHLELLLPTVRQAIEFYRGDMTIDVLIVDNGCDENTRRFSEENFPEFRYVFSPVNDYLFSLNGFIRDLPAEYLLMLNDDMKLEQNILNELLPIIQNDNELFAVSCRIMDFEGTYTASAVRTARYSKGWMYSYYLDPAENATKYTLYPGGGAAIFRTEYFNRLNGFDPLYRPAYSEDADLGIRSWQQGWKVIYHPPAILYHREGGTINDQFKKDRLEQMLNKNHILWMVKNTRRSGFLFWFLLMAPARLLVWKKKNPNLYKGFIATIGMLPGLIQKRRAAGKPVVKDEEWMKLLNMDYAKPSSHAAGK